MKKLSLMLLAMLVLCATSCKKETEDVTSLLKTVPSSAAGVVVFNMEGLISDAGCKIKGHEIIPGDEVKQMIDKATSGQKENIMMLFDGSTGIEPKGAVIFYDANRTYLTVSLHDVDKFCSFIEKSYQSTFTDEGSGVKVCKNIAVKGAQAWMCIATGRRLDVDAIANYASLATSQSFLVTPMGEKLLTEEDDVRGWALIDTFTSQFLSRTQQSMFKLGLGFLFENAQSVRFEVNFKKGEVEAEAQILNDQGKPAKYQLPGDKVDVATLKGLGETCDAMMAFTITPKLVKKLDELSKTFGGALFGDLTDFLKNVDGTVGIISSGSGMDQSMNGVLTTKGEATADLRDFISTNMGPVKVEGNLLMFSKGDVKGSLNVAECAEELKGCCMGVVVDGSGVSTLGYGETAPAGFKSMVLKLNPESGSLEIEVEANTSDPSENALLTIMKSI